MMLKTAKTTNHVQEELKKSQKTTDRLFQKELNRSLSDTVAKNEINDYREISIFKDGVTL